MEYLNGTALHPSVVFEINGFPIISFEHRCKKCVQTPLHFWPFYILEPHTNFNHVIFGLLGSEKAWHDRKHYMESWWRPNVTHGFLYLDEASTGSGGRRGDSNLEY